MLCVIIIICNYTITYITEVLLDICWFVMIIFTKTFGLIIHDVSGLSIICNMTFDESFSYAKISFEDTELCGLEVSTFDQSECVVSCNKSNRRD